MSNVLPVTPRELLRFPSDSYPSLDLRALPSGETIQSALSERLMRGGAQLGTLLLERAIDNAPDPEVIRRAIGERALTIRYSFANKHRRSQIGQPRAILELAGDAATLVVEDAPRPEHRNATVRWRRHTDGVYYPDGNPMVAGLASVTPARRNLEDGPWVDRRAIIQAHSCFTVTADHFVAGISQAVPEYSAVKISG